MVKSIEPVERIKFFGDNEEESDDEIVEESGGGGGDDEDDDDESGYRLEVDETEFVLSSKGNGGEIDS